LIDGFDHFTNHHLTKFLEERGFHISYSRHIESDDTLSHIGSFFASRTKPNYEVRPVVEGRPLTAEASVQWLRAIDYLNSEDWSLLSVFAGYAGWMRSMAFSPDGRKVITGSADGNARLWR
jgi:WD40 repeat protein